MCDYLTSFHCSWSLILSVYLFIWPFVLCEYSGLVEFVGRCLLLAVYSLSNVLGYGQAGALERRPNKREVGKLCVGLLLPRSAPPQRASACKWMVFATSALWKERDLDFQFEREVSHAQGIGFGKSLSPYLQLRGISAGTTRTSVEFEGRRWQI